MQWQHGIRAVIEVGEGGIKRRIDTEEFHDNESVEVERFIRRQLEEEDEQVKYRYPNPDLAGTAAGFAGKGGGSSIGRLGKLAQYRNKAGDITSSIVSDDLTGMKLDAGKVVEARAKEVTYLRDKRVYDKIPRHQAVRNKWKIIRTRWIDINKGDEKYKEY